MTLPALVPTRRSASAGRIPATCSRARVTPAWYAMPTVPPPPKTMPRRREVMASPYDTGGAERDYPQQMMELQRLREGVVVVVGGGGGGELCAGAGAGAGGGAGVGGAWGGGGGGAARWAESRRRVTAM